MSGGMRIEEQRQIHRPERIKGVGEFRVWLTIDWPRGIEVCNGALPVHRADGFSKHDAEIVMLRAFGGETIALRGHMNRLYANGYAGGFLDAAKLLAERGPNR